MELHKVGKESCPEIYDMQIRAFKPLLEKYQDYDTNPGAESIDMVYECFRQPCTDYWMIAAEGKNIGAIRVRNYGKICILNQIVILPDYQNRGYGQEAIKAIEAKYPGATRWELDTLLQEEKLCRLYEKMGYARTGQVENIKEGMDLVYYGKGHM